ncbi:hypothetical protein MJ560_05445 [Klebsiella pneumoniae]|nr:hypothetical protein MJ560_05445 [Klebsiella pneumoniae]
MKSLRYCTTIRRRPTSYSNQALTFTIRPMVNAGKKEIRSMKDGWTVKTKDRSLST